MKTRFNLRLTAAISAVVMFSGMSPFRSLDVSPVHTGSSVDVSLVNTTGTIELAASQPTERLLMRRASDNMYIVRLEDPATASYAGGIAG